MAFTILSLISGILDSYLPISLLYKMPANKQLDSVDVEHIGQSASSHFFKGEEFGFCHIFSLRQGHFSFVGKEVKASYPLQSGAEYIAKKHPSSRCSAFSLPAFGFRECLSEIQLT